MDKNKLTKLNEIGYQIAKTCSLCTHSSFSTSNDGFGICDAHTYTHLKHSEDVSYLSVHRCGGCPQFKPDQEKLIRLHGYKELLQK